MHRLGRGQVPEDGARQRKRGRWPLLLFVMKTMRSALGSDPIGLALKLVKRTEVSLGRCHNDVGVSPHPIDHTPTVLQTHSHFPLALSGATDGIDRVQHLALINI